MSHRVLRLVPPDHPALGGVMDVNRVAVIQYQLCLEQDDVHVLLDVLRDALATRATDAMNAKWAEDFIRKMEAVTR